MSKLRCTCGEIISDTTDYLPYKGYLTPDSTYFDQLDDAAKDVAAFLQARENGAEKQWLSSNCGPEDPAVQRSPASIIEGLIARHLFRNQRRVYQCVVCRRLLVQQNDRSNQFYSFTPDEPAKPDIFA